MKENLKLWNLVEKTNPKYTKKANVKGNQITSIAPQFQIMNVTEQFGIYGSTWGFKDIELDYKLADNFGLVVFKATFFFPNGEFPIVNAINLFIDNAKTKIDDNFAKKVETDSLTKAISKLGFNADIFLGKFDDERYLAEVKAEFDKPIPPPNPKVSLNKTQFSKLMDKLIKSENDESLKEIEKYEKNNYIFTSSQSLEMEELLKSRV